MTTVDTTCHVCGAQIPAERLEFLAGSNVREFLYTCLAHASRARKQGFYVQTDTEDEFDFVVAEPRAGSDVPWLVADDDEDDDDGEPELSPEEVAIKLRISRAAGEDRSPTKPSTPKPRTPRPPGPRAPRSNALEARATTILVHLRERPLRSGEWAARCGETRSTYDVWRRALEKRGLVRKTGERWHLTTAST